MSLSKGLFCIAALTLNAAVASEIYCPGVHRTHGKPLPLSNASVFSGPPEELADLIPNLETSEWDIARDQAAAKARSQSMYLVCRYRHTKETVKLTIPPDATLCKVEQTDGGAVSAWCKSEVRRSVKSNAKGAHGHQS